MRGASPMRIRRLQGITRICKQALPRLRQVQIRKAGASYPRRKENRRRRMRSLIRNRIKNYIQTAYL